MNGQVLTDGHEQVLGSVIPVALLGPVGGGALQLVVPNLHTLDEDREPA